MAGYQHVVEAYLVTAQAFSGSDNLAGKILHDDTAEVRQHYAPAHGELVLIRPDGYIGFRGPSSATTALERYLSSLFGPEQVAMISPISPCGE
jgi:hypothetical protein